MRLFKRSTKKTTDAAEPKKAPAKTKKPAAEPKTEDRVVPASAKAAAIGTVLVAPRVSEKAATLAGSGTYVFNVPVDANKVEIRKAVELLYKVNVVGVRTVRGIGKVVRRGRAVGRRNRWKKALVTLKAGQKIELYEGV